MPRRFTATVSSSLDRIEKLLGQGRFPLVLGGDCSILLGSALALRKRGTIWIAVCRWACGSAHSRQIRNPEGAAGMDLALTTGLGPELLTSIDGMKAVHTSRGHGHFRLSAATHQARHLLRLRSHRWEHSRST